VVVEEEETLLTVCETGLGNGRPLLNILPMAGAVRG